MQLSWNIGCRCEVNGVIACCSIQQSSNSLRRHPPRNARWQRVSGEPQSCKISKASRPNADSCKLASITQLRVPRQRSQRRRVRALLLVARGRIANSPYISTLLLQAPAAPHRPAWNQTSSLSPTSRSLPLAILFGGSSPSFNPFTPRLLLSTPARTASSACFSF